MTGALPSSYHQSLRAEIFTHPRPFPAPQLSPVPAPALPGAAPLPCVQILPHALSLPGVSRNLSATTCSFLTAGPMLIFLGDAGCTNQHFMHSFIALTPGAAWTRNARQEAAIGEVWWFLCCECLSLGTQGLLPAFSATLCFTGGRQGKEKGRSGLCRPGPVSFVQKIAFLAAPGKQTVRCVGKQGSLAPSVRPLQWLTP